MYVAWSVLQGCNSFAPLIGSNERHKGANWVLDQHSLSEIYNTRGGGGRYLGWVPNCVPPLSYWNRTFGTATGLVALLF